MSILFDIAPASLGLPPKFGVFREAQQTALEYILASDHRFIGANAPTGLGKSVLGVAAALALESKSVYLTSTKALQDQIQGDFGVIGMQDIRGRANYPCRLYATQTPKRVSNKRVTCDIGAEQFCSVRNTTGCPYFMAYEEAKASLLINTNYAYWLHSRSNSSTALESSIVYDPVGLLICDEAHNAFEELAGFMAIRLDKAEIKDMSLTGSGLMSEMSGDVWKEFAHQRLKEVVHELGKLRDLYGSVTVAKQEEPERYALLEQLKRRYSRISAMDEEWTWETNADGVSFDCIWPGKFSSALWSNVEKVLLMSATLFPYTLQLLGLKRNEYDYRVFNNGWPANRGLVYYLPTAKLNYQSTDEDYRQLVRQMDDIIDARADRKGIVHTVSYSRMRKIIEMSRHRGIILYNETAGQSKKIADQFRQAKPPAVLVSPSYGTGWDFPYQQCEYQVIVKIPFPNAESRVMQERIKDADYRVYRALLDLTQYIGRGRRAPDDRCETFILDQNWPLVLAKGRRLDAHMLNVHRIAAVPKRPEKLA